ncbi:hypothetical protein WA026_006608 [Henosepilachna vigintioctopunctata]|uniref:Uncharacterized protein n=1 Tax=Henosepilachna vigintioctopunctata TaxID=420089 RepID=A0AAW1UEG2_9CUCU
MENWLKISLILSLFGFFKEIRPSEPFVYEYLSGKWTNITEQEVSEQIFAVGTYINTPLVVVAFLVTDLSRYKPLIILCGIFGIIVWNLLIWFPTLLMMQLMEFFYAAFISCDIAYFTYMYAKVDKEHYPKVTSNTRMAYLLGRSMSGVLGQILVSLEIMDYKELNYISLLAMIMATATCLFLPSVEHSIYFHQKGEQKTKLAKSEKFIAAFRLMGRSFKDSFSKDLVVKWSLVHAISTCGFGLVEVYSQTLWTEINKTDHVVLQNGIVVAVYTLIGVVGAYFAGYFRIDWSKISIFVFSAYFSISGALLIYTSYTNSVYVSYAVYCTFCGLYQFMVTVAFSEISQRIPPDSYGLILGVNAFVALVLQSIITSIVINMLHAPVRQQYLIFGLCHLVILSIYLIYELYRKVYSKVRRNSPDIAIC